MNVRAARQAGRVNLDDRPDHHELPTGAQPRDRVEQRGVEPLVNHAEEAEARARDGGLVCGVCDAGARPREVRAVNARREGVDARVPVALGLVETLAAREDEVGAHEQLLLKTSEQRRRALEGRQLVHAIVDGRERA
jgi:hypothetical protein